MTNLQKTAVITTVGFGIGLAEALIYYNMGESKGKSFSYKIPPTGELMKTSFVVLATSLLTGMITTGVESKLNEIPSTI